MSETITLRLPPATARKLREIAKKEGKDRSMLIRELLEHGVKEKGSRIRRLNSIVQVKLLVGRQPN